MCAKHTDPVAVRLLLLLLCFKRPKQGVGVDGIEPSLVEAVVKYSILKLGNTELKY